MFFFQTLTHAYVPRMTKDDDSLHNFCLTTSVFKVTHLLKWPLYVLFTNGSEALQIASTSHNALPERNKICHWEFVHNVLRNLISHGTLCVMPRLKTLAHLLVVDNHINLIIKYFSVHNIAYFTFIAHAVLKRLYVSMHTLTLYH